MIRFVSTEAGLRLLQTTLRTYLWTTRFSVVLPGRIQQTSLGTTDPQALAMQAGFLRLVSVTEAALDTLGVELTSKDVPNPGSVITLLMLEKELASTSSWAVRRKAFKRHHHLDIHKCARFGEVEGAIEVRNAIAHGLGRLTTRQVQSAETAKLLQRVNVSIVNGFVELRAGHLRECADYCFDFLSDVDGRLP